ncbi:S41 family peptidase [Motiliproteus sediminis]|uniref:S41 family peptidase n=1 Tax=Motiliproteus sediminis TaxID=1468178 RepID=UPI001AEF9312|nr:S41 family peptidase [Motiliproteus sediminis]
MKLVNRLISSVALAIGLSLPLSVLYAAPEGGDSAPAGVGQAPLPLEELRTFTEVFERIKGAYVEEVDDATLLENAIKGMLSGLDPHSAYMDPRSFKNLQVHTSGEFGGLGIEVGMESGFIRVIAPIDDTPAERAGILAGDMIIKLDDNAVQGMGLVDAVNLMRGKPGTDIVLTIMREGDPKPKKITVTRDVIKVTSVRSRMLDEHFGYLRISQFQVNSGKDLKAAMVKLAEKGDLKGYILDLRNNPGGVLQAAVEVSDAFLKGGLVVYTEGRIDQAELRFSATEEDPSEGLPLVVLINGGSASASEIVAGALQDHGRAVVMGTRSFGKGSVQTVLPLTNERALKLTTARYYTPDGRSIQAEGIVPDIEVEPATVTRLEGRVGVKEADLVGHLENGNGGHRDDKAPARNGVDRELLDEDYPLNEALNLLKGLSILSRVSP